MRSALRSAPARRRGKTIAKSNLTAANFAVIVGVTYLISSLSGQVMVEKARREGIAASARAAEARKVVDELSQRLASLRDLPAVEAWAKTHKFFLPDQLAQTGEKQVAQSQ